MAEAVVRAPRDPEPRPAGCPVCRMDVRPRAQRCAYCGEWLVPTRLNATDAVLRVLGYLWATLSIFGALYLWSTSSGTPAATNIYGDPVPRSFLDSMSLGIAVAMLLQGLVFGLALVSYAQRGPREWAP